MSCLLSMHECRSYLVFQSSRPYLVSSRPYLVSCSSRPYLVLSRSY